MGALAAITATAVALLLPAGARADRCALVSNAADNTISIIDVASSRVTRTVRVGRRPAAIAVNPDARIAYAGNTNDPDEDIDRTPGIRDTLSVIDTHTGEVTDMIEVGRSPHGIVVTPDGQFVIEADTFQGTLSVIETARNEVVRTVAAGIFPVIPAIDARANRLFVGDGRLDNVRVLDLATYEIRGLIPVVSGPRGIAFHPDGGKAYVTGVGSQHATVIDTDALAVVRTISLGAQPFMVAAAPGRRRLYVGLLTSGQVGVIDMDSDMLVARIDVGAFPFFLAVDPEERLLYVVLRLADSVAVVDLDQGRRVDLIAVGREPRGIALVDLPGACPAGRAADVWRARTPLSVRRQEIGAAELEGHVYAVGGFGGESEEEAETLASVERYDPARDVWEQVAPLPQPVHHPAVVAAGGNLYVIGGMQGLSFTPVNKVHVYLPESGRWEERAPLLAPRGAAAAAVIDGLIYVAGGRRQEAVDDFAVYDPQADVWSELPRMPTARDHLGAGAIGGVFYAVGGRSRRGMTDAVESYDPAAGRWRTDLQRMPVPRAAMASAVAAGRLFAFGGEGSLERADGLFRQVEAYHPQADRWEAFPAMRWPRHGAAAIADGRRILVVAGGSIEGFGPTAGSELFLVPGSNCPGDCVGDGLVGAAEIASAIAALFSGISDPACPLVAFDSDGDSVVVAADLVAAIRSATAGCSQADR